ncbi:hypothetical protein [Actinoplanes palleronii]|uniref:Uncharacterized protein n=1 Tax=Actinoplanes palleronii TaxID=113570 RepID=A0ABQ4BKC9_9ACTN|nr:hypothetical protein [Actinoplanes palleronii]GIE71132.1 hypothetical protein Apa02nite_072400 [Actinoplanes palleronii]
MTVTDEQLASTGNVVHPGYRHVTKQFSPGAPLALPATYLKWYDLRRTDQAVHEVGARAFLTAEITAGRLPISGDLGFVIHHRSGEHVHLLLVCTWRDDNEMWETVYVRDIRRDDTFALMPPTTHRGVICVWEFGVVAHEHAAWTRYLRSTRDTAAKRAYTESLRTGTI